MNKAPAKPTAAEIAARPNAPLTPEGFFADGPTLEEYIEAGYKAENYPPAGYAPRGTITEKSGKRYFHAVNSSQVKAHDGRQFMFSPYAFLAGTWMGTYATEDPKEIAVLEAMIKGKRHGIEEINELDFENAQKKKAVALQGWGPSLIHTEAARNGQPGAQPAEAPNTEPQPAPAPQAITADSFQLASGMPVPEDQSGA